MSFITALKDGDEDAYEQIFLAYKEKVLNYFIKKTNSIADAEDLLQNTFLRLWKYRASLNPDYLIEQHLFQMARTVFIDFTRKQNHLRKIVFGIGEEVVSRELPEGTKQSENEELEKILNQLPAMRRRVFIMHKVERYSYKEIAHILSISVKSVDNHISRATKKIREALLTFFF